MQFLGLSLWLWGFCGTLFFLQMRPLGQSRAASAGRALLRASLSYTFENCLQQSGFLLRASCVFCSCLYQWLWSGFSTVSHLCLGTELCLLLFHLTPFIFCLIFEWWRKYMAGKGWEDQRYCFEVWECWLMQGEKEYSRESWPKEGQGQGFVIEWILLLSYNFPFHGVQGYETIDYGFTACWMLSLS